MAQFCDNCRMLNENIKTICRPEKFLKVPNKNYINVCPNCIKEKEWESQPEYQINELEHFVNKRRCFSLVPSLIETEDGRSYLTFTDGKGKYISTKELKLIVDSLIDTIKLEGIDDAFEEFNEINIMAANFQSDPNEIDKFLFPFDRLGIKRKQFKTDKRKWSFTCGNCSEKVSSDDFEEYFSIVSRISGTSERACSKGCAYVISKELTLNWIYEKQYEKFFNLSKMDEMLKNHITEI